MQLDLDLACLRTIVKLLDRLQLQPVDGTTRSESVHVQSRLFYRYFHMFSRALQRWKEVGTWLTRRRASLADLIVLRGRPPTRKALRVEM